MEWFALAWQDRREAGVCRRQHPSGVRVAQGAGWGRGAAAALCTLSLEVLGGQDVPSS